MGEGPSFTLRGANPLDRERWREMFLALVATGPEPCASDAPDYVWTCVGDPRHPMKLLIAADADDRAIGFLLYLTHPYSWTRRSITYLLDLYVDPGARGAGIGTALIGKLAAIGREAGWLKIYWMTQADNERAHALYGKLAQRSPLVRYDLHLNGYELAGQSE
jgi:ribosomal protein S18 acetylase RimI-like enzyme